MKFTQPTTRTIPLAQDSGLPRVSGEGRLRARTPASFRHKAPYSSSRCSRQKASVRATIRSWAACAGAAAVDPPRAVLARLRPLDDRRFRLGRLRFPCGGRERRDDAEPLLGLLVALVEAPLDPAAEGDVVPRDQPVVDDLALEGQQGRLDHPGQVRPDHRPRTGRTGRGRHRRRPAPSRTGRPCHSGAGGRRRTCRRRGASTTGRSRDRPRRSGTGSRRRRRRSGPCVRGGPCGP